MNAIQLEIAGAVIHASVRSIDPFGVEVSLSDPHYGLSGERFLPPDEQASTSENTALRKQMAEDLSFELYRIASYVAANLDQIRPIFQKTLERIEQINPEQADRQYERDWEQVVEKIAQGRAGVNEFRWQLQSMRETKNLVDDMIRSVKDDFFDRCFPFPVNYDLREDVFDYLESRMN